MYHSFQKQLHARAGKLLPRAAPICQQDSAPLRPQTPKFSLRSQKLRRHVHVHRALDGLPGSGSEGTSVLLPGPAPVITFKHPSPLSSSSSSLFFRLAFFSFFSFSFFFFFLVGE